MYYKIISLIFILGTSIHVYFLQLNQIVKTNIGFENIKLIDHFKNLSVNGFGDGGLGFLYSLLIAPVDIFINNHLLSSQLVNIILIIISGILLLNLGKKYLHPTYRVLMLIIFFISSNIINYTNNIDILNLYIPLLLSLILVLHGLISETSIKSMDVKIRGINVKVTNNYYVIKKSIFVAIILSLLFFTVNISIIYLISVFLILLYLLLGRKINLTTLLISYSTIVLIFIVIISPYLYITGIDKQTDKVKAIIVNSQIINQENNSEFIKQNIYDLIEVFPKIILGNIIDSYNDKSFIFFENKNLYIYILIPIFFLLIGLYKLLFSKKIRLTEKRNLFPIVFFIFIVILLFFSLFNIPISNFSVLVPVFILIICLGAQEIFIFEKDFLSSMKLLTLSFIFISIYMQGVLHIYTYDKYRDNNYQGLKEIGLWLKDSTDDINKSKIIGISPSVSYYSLNDYFGNIPKVKNTNELIAYIKSNNIDYLIINSLTLNNSNIKDLIQDNYESNTLTKIKEINKIGQKLILYKVKY